MIITRSTTTDAEHTMCRIQDDLQAIQRVLHQLHAEAPLQGPSAGQFRAVRRRWYEVEYEVSHITMLSRQALAFRSIAESTGL